MLGIYNQVQGWRSSTGSVLQSGSLAIVSYLVHRMVQMWWREEQRRGGGPGTWGLVVLQFQIGSLRCQVRPHREENININSIREGAMSGDGLSRIDTTAEMLTALSEKQQEDENGWRSGGGENCGKWHFRAQSHHSTWIIAIVGAWRMQTALGGGPHSRLCAKMSGGVEERSWEAQRRDVLKPWMYLVRVRREKEWLRVYF